LQDSTATGAANVTVYVQLPTGKPAFFLDAAVNDILPYLRIGNDGSGNPVYKLFDPPIWPRPVNAGEIVQNASGSPTAPNWVAQYPLGHS
jgi:hypothetical protein